MRSDSVASGDDAVAALCRASAEGDAYDFLVLDCSLNMTATIHDIPTILLTPGLRSGAYRWGPGIAADVCLTKPVRQSQLWNALAAIRAKRMSAGGSSPSSEPASRLPGEFAGASLWVLVADDNVVNQKVAVRMLEKLGLRIDVAGNGAEAVRMLKAIHYDAVFMDCQMPEMDGYEATKEIRRTEKPGQHVAIIAMTAEALAGARERCFSVGMDDYIAKPVNVQELSRVIRRCILRHAAELA